VHGLHLLDALTAYRIVFPIENKEKIQEILKQKDILIVGTATKVVKYLKVSLTTQCTSC